MSWKKEYLKSVYTGFVGGAVVSIFMLKSSEVYVPFFSFKFWNLILFGGIFVLLGAIVFKTIDRYF